MMSETDSQIDSEVKEYGPEVSCSVTSSEVDIGDHKDAMDFGTGPVIEPSEVSPPLNGLVAPDSAPSDGENNRDALVVQDMVVHETTSRTIGDQRNS